MHMFKKLSTQAIACAVLSSQVIGVDGTPDLLDPSSPSDKIPDRSWFFEKEIVLCDLEGVPDYGGELTEGAFFTLFQGQCDETFHTFVNTGHKIKNPYVKSMHHIDLTQQPTFTQSAPQIAEIINNRILYSWGAFDPHKLAQSLRMQGGTAGSIPTGTTIEFHHADGHAMERRDAQRDMGIILLSPMHKKFTVVVESPTKVKEEYDAKRKENKKKRLEAKKRKENKELDREIDVLIAKANGKRTPEVKQRKKSRLSGISFKQEEVAKRKGITAPLGAASIGLNADKLNQDHGIPKEHVNHAHHAMHDTQILSGLAMAQAQPTLVRKLRREKEELLDVKKKLNFDDIENNDSPKKKLKRERSLSKAEGVLNSDVQIPSPQKRPKL